MTRFALVSLGLGVLALLLAVVLGRIRGRRLELTLRRARAIEWFGPMLADPGEAPGQEPHDEARTELGDDTSTGTGTGTGTGSVTDTEAHPGSAPS